MRAYIIFYGRIDTPFQPIRSQYLFLKSFRSVINTVIWLKYLSFIENHVKVLPMVGFVAEQQFICHALGIVARI